MTNNRKAISYIFYKMFKKHSVLQLTTVIVTLMFKRPIKIIAEILFIA